MSGWKNKTAGEIINDMQLLIDKHIENSKNIEQPDTEIYTPNKMKQLKRIIFKENFKRFFLRKPFYKLLNLDTNMYKVILKDK